MLGQAARPGSGEIVVEMELAQLGVPGGGDHDVDREKTAMAAHIYAHIHAHLNAHAHAHAQAQAHA